MPPKTIILAFDGTNGEFNQANSNVAKLCALLLKNDNQMLYYQPGVGTYVNPGIRGSIEKWFAKVADLAFAWYLDEHVMGGYEYLMNNHLPGDTVVMFGFSRGAYTARALAGMLNSVGLLPKDNHEQITFAYKIYKNKCNLHTSFKQTFCKSVEIKMLGVWDTVASVGAIWSRTLPFTSDESIRVFRHAISLDEHRVRFNVTLWKHTPPKVTSQATQKPPTSVKEMWFAGAHTDVGGSAEMDTAPASLSNITLRWMLREIQSAHCGIVFDNDALDRMNIPRDCVPRVIPRPNLNLRRPNNNRNGIDDTVFDSDDSSSQDTKPKPAKLADPIIMGQEEMEVADINTDIHDELQMHPWYWFLQIPTLNGKRLDFTGTRQFPVDEEQQKYDRIHSSVLKRTKLGKGYQPRANLPNNWEENLVANDP